MPLSIPGSLSTATYIIYTDGTTIYAVNGTTKNIDYQGTNASTVIQNAITNSNRGQGGGLIHIKAGQYNLSSGLVCPTNYGSSHYVIQGEGQDQTILNNLSTNDALTLITIESTVKDLTIVGSSNSGNGIRCTMDFNGAYEGGGFNTLYNLGIHNNNNGIYLVYEPDFDHILNCTITNNRGHGIYLNANGAASGVSVTTIEHCYISGNGGNGVVIGGGNTNNITNCEITRNGGYGIYVGDEQTVITNPIISSNAKGAIYSDRPTLRTIIFGQNIQGSVNLGTYGYCTVPVGGTNCTGYNKWFL